jgi:hypothetical protein
MHPDAGEGTATVQFAKTRNLTGGKRCWRQHFCSIETVMFPNEFEALGDLIKTAVVEIQRDISDRESRNLEFKLVSVPGIPFPQRVSMRDPVCRK